MVAILNKHQQYVPSSTSTTEAEVAGSQDTDLLQLDTFHTLLFHGDQLTVERMRSAQAIQANSETGKGKLKGIIPVVADWHAKVNFLGVSWITLYL